MIEFVHEMIVNSGFRSYSHRGSSIAARWPQARFHSTIEAAVTKNFMSLPPFLHGCFDWRVNGLHWAAPPPLELLSRAALESVDPFVVLASVVEHAKMGDHDKAGHLVPFFHRHDPFALARVALLVFADIAKHADLQRLADVLRSEDSNARAYAAEAAALSGSLALVPVMLDAWTRASTLGDHETIGFAISDMLEVEPGPIADHVGIYDLPPLGAASHTPARERLLELNATLAEIRSEEPPPLPGLVMAEHQRLAAELGPDAFVWAGAPLDVNRLVDHFLRAAKDPSPGSGQFINLRHRFEAWTGERCEHFFYAFRSQRLEITATLEDFVRSGKGSRYRPGQRYFYGHPIP